MIWRNTNSSGDIVDDLEWQLLSFLFASIPQFIVVLYLIKEPDKYMYLTHHKVSISVDSRHITCIVMPLIKILIDFRLKVQVNNISVMSELLLERGRERRIIVNRIGFHRR